MRSPTLLLIMCFCSISAFADQSADNQVAMKQTQDMLTNQKSRQAAINQSPKAKAADAYTQKVMGSEANVNEAYSISAALLPWILSESNGDPVKMQKMLDAAMKDPEAFLNRMPAQERERVKKLSQAVPQPSRP